MTSKAYRLGWELVFGSSDKNDEEEGEEMVKVEHLVKTKTFQKLPAALNKHKAFQKIKQIKRIFPYIGLKNCLEPCNEVFNGKQTYIGFSSSGATGLWDIATMSMRGVCSCMHWNNTHSHHLIGSITDPFLGIVYLTDNEKTPYGISFRKRALVRFVYDSITKDYKLVIERPYLDTGNTDPSVYTNKDPQAHATLLLFKNFLTSKVDAKYKVIITSERSYREAIPKSTSLEEISAADRSMSDGGIYYESQYQDDKFIAQFAHQA